MGRALITRITGQDGAYLGEFLLSKGSEVHGINRRSYSSEMGIRRTWHGRGMERREFDSDGRCTVVVDPRYFRSAEVEALHGNAWKARTKLGWSPKVPFRELVAKMVAADLQEASRYRLVHQSGYRIYNHQD